MSRNIGAKFRQPTEFIAVFSRFFARQIAIVFFLRTIGVRIFFTWPAAARVILAFPGLTLLHHLLQILLRIQQRAPIQFAGDLTFKSVEERFNILPAGALPGLPCFIHLPLELRHCRQALGPLSCRLLHAFGEIGKLRHVTRRSQLSLEIFQAPLAFGGCGGIPTIV